METNPMKGRYVNFYRTYDNSRLEELDIKRHGYGSWDHINFLFNRSGSILIVSGDYGEAIFNWYSSSNTLNNIADYSKSLDYFAGKCTACSRPIRDYDLSAAREQIMDWLNDCAIDDSDFGHPLEDSDDLSAWKSKEDFVCDLAAHIDENNGLAFLDDEDLLSAITSIDDDWFEIVYSFGQKVSDDIIFYASALQWGMKQVEKEQKDEN